MGQHSYPLAIQSVNHFFINSSLVSNGGRCVYVSEMFLFWLSLELQHSPSLCPIRKCHCPAHHTDEHHNKETPTTHSPPQRAFQVNGIALSHTLPPLPNCTITVCYYPPLELPFSCFSDSKQRMRGSKGKNFKNFF